jgi:hypothetical protein
MAEKIIAGLTIAVCVVLLLRLCLGARLRYRFDTNARGAWLSARRSALNLWHWRSSRREAQHAADAAIQRAQRKAASAFERDGNVYKPDAFRGAKLDLKRDPTRDPTRDPKEPRDPRNLH